VGESLENTRAKWLELGPSDNVLIRISESSAPPAEVISAANGRGEFHTVSEIPKGHKVASKPIRKGEPILKFGQVIGKATENISTGAHVHVHNVSMPDGGVHFEAGLAKYSFEKSDKQQLPQTFFGYPRENGIAGIRNYLAVVARAEAESWLRAKVDPSDIVQQTLLDAHRGLENFRGHTEAEWLGWLRQILNHNAADFVRHYRGTAMRGGGREVPLGPAGSDWLAGTAPEPAAADPTPSEFLIRHERELQVADAMALLSDDHREVILLRNLQRLPFDEVAQRMGRSRPAVQMLWMRAIRALQESLAEPDAQSGIMPDVAPAAALGPERSDG